MCMSEDNSFRCSKPVEINQDHSKRTKACLEQGSQPPSRVFSRDSKAGVGKLHSEQNRKVSGVL